MNTTLNPDNLDSHKHRRNWISLISAIGSTFMIVGTIAMVFFLVGCEPSDLTHPSADSALDETESALLLSVKEAKDAEALKVKPAQEDILPIVTPYEVCMSGCKDVGDFRFCHTRCKQLVVDITTKEKPTQDELADAIQKKKEAAEFLFADSSEKNLITAVQRTPYEVCMDYCVQVHSFDSCHKTCKELVISKKDKASELLDLIGIEEPHDCGSDTETLDIKTPDKKTPNKKDFNSGLTVADFEEAEKDLLGIDADRTPYEVCMDYCNAVHSFDYCHKTCKELVTAKANKAAALAAAQKKAEAEGLLSVDSDVAADKKSSPQEISTDDSDEAADKKTGAQDLSTEDSDEAASKKEDATQIETVSPADEKEKGLLGIAADRTAYEVCMDYCVGVHSFDTCHNTCKELVIAKAEKAASLAAAELVEDELSLASDLGKKKSIAEEEAMMSLVAIDRTPYEVCMDYCNDVHSFNYCHKTCKGLVIAKKKAQAKFFGLTSDEVSTASKKKN